MKRDKKNPQLVELTEAEQVVHEWYMSLLDLGYSHGSAAERILTSVPVDKATWNALNNQEFRDWLAGSMKRYPHNQPEVCGATLTVGTTDPSSTECDQPPNHDGKHEGDDPISTGILRVRWSGGGSCAGDRLPVRDIEWVNA